MSAPQRLSNFKNPNRFAALANTNPPPAKGMGARAPTQTKAPTSSHVRPSGETKRLPAQGPPKILTPDTHPPITFDDTMGHDDQEDTQRGRSSKFTGTRARSQSRASEDPDDSDFDMEFDEDANPARKRNKPTAQPHPRPTSHRPRSFSRSSNRSRSRHRHVAETKEPDASDTSTDYDSDDRPPVRNTLPRDFQALLDRTNAQDNSVTHADATPEDPTIYPPSPAFSPAPDRPQRPSTNATKHTHAQTPTPPHTVNPIDEDNAPSDENVPPLTTEAFSATPAINPTPSTATTTQPAPMRYADVVRESNSEASSDSDHIPTKMRSRFLRPSADTLTSLLARMEAVNAMPLQSKLEAIDDTYKAIEQARTYVNRPEVTWVYFPRPPKVIQKGKPRNVLSLSEKFHYRFTLGAQDPTFSEWSEHLGRFEYHKLDGKDIVRVHLSSFEARDALIGVPMDLGYFGIVTLQGAPVDPWDAIQYIDIPHLPYSEWQKVATGFAALGAIPSFFGCRQGVEATGYRDNVPRFYFGKEFPSCLTIGGKYPRQISYGGRLYLVFIKDFSPPRLDNPRKACAELLTLNPPTRKTPDGGMSHSIAPAAKRHRATPAPATPVVRTSEQRTPLVVDLQDSDSDLEESSDEALQFATIQYAATPGLPDASGNNTAANNALWAPVPGVTHSDPQAPHLQTPARLFVPGTCTFRSMGFPYRSLDAQFVTLTKGNLWPKDTSTAVRRVRQHHGHLVLSPTAITMHNLDKWLEENAHTVATSLQTTMDAIEENIQEELATNHSLILEHIRACHPHSVVKILQSKYVAGQCSLASIARDGALKESQHALDLIHQHFFQRVLSATTPTHCVAFTTKFSEFYKTKPSGANIRKAMNSFMKDPSLASPLPNRPTGSSIHTVKDHELALAWFELHLMAQAPIVYASHEAHSLLAGGFAVNRLPCWNSELLPSWLLQRIVQSPLGKTIVEFMTLIAPELYHNQLLLAEVNNPQWSHPTIHHLSIELVNDRYEAEWPEPQEFMPQGSNSCPAPKASNGALSN